jgi:hypothetical protein
MATGLGIGLIGPALLFGLFYGWKGEGMAVVDFLAQQYQARLLAPVLSLCALANLGSFWLLIQRQQYDRVRGVVLATLLLGITIVVLKFQG